MILIFPNRDVSGEQKAHHKLPHNYSFWHIYWNKKAFSDPTVVPLSLSKRCQFSPGCVLKINWTARVGILMSRFHRNHEYGNTQTWNYWIHTGPLWVFRRCGISVHTFWPTLQTGYYVEQRVFTFLYLALCLQRPEKYFVIQLNWCYLL